MNIDYKIIRTNRKTLSLSIDKQGSLIIRAPKLMPNQIISDFVKKNQDWIIKTIQKQQSLNSAFPPIQGIDNEKILYLGHTLTVKITNTAKTELIGETLCIPRNKDAVNEIRSWYKTKAKEILPSLTKEYADIAGFKYSSVKITSAKTRFGSCSSKNNINYSYRLMMYDKECIKYIIIHELCHTKHKDHSPKFWAEVERLIPNCKLIRNRMRKSGAIMDMI